MEKITAILLLLSLIRAEESTLQYKINAPLLDTITQITRHFNNKNFMNVTKSWSYLPEDSQKIKNLTITLTPVSSKSNHIVCKFFDNLQINLFNYEKIIGRGEFHSRNDKDNMVRIIIREPNISVIHDNIGFRTQLQSLKKKSVMFNFTTKHPNTKRRQQLGEELTDVFTNSIKNRIGTVANPIEMVEICKQPFKNAEKFYNWFSLVEHKREHYFFLIIAYSYEPSGRESTEIMMKNMTQFDSIEVRYLPDDVANFNLSIRNVSGNMIKAGNGTEPTEFNFTMDLFQLIMNYSTINTPTDVKVQTNGFKVRSSINESLIQEVFEKITAYVMKRSLSTDTNIDFMANYTIIPEFDITNSLVNAIKEMTISQFDNRTSPNKIQSSGRKDQIIKSTYNFESEKIMYRLDITWEYNAVLMSVGKTYSDSYFGLSLKNVKVQGTWEHKGESDQKPCTGKISKVFSDIDALLDLLLKFSINNTIKPEMRSDDLFQNIAPDRKCKNQTESKEKVSKNLETKSYLKIVTRALEVIPSLYDGYVNLSSFLSTDDSYAYFINDNDTSAYNNELMIRGWHRPKFKKITVQYPDYGQVTNGSEFKIPIWRAKMSWFRCNKLEKPMHMDVEPVYLILKGNISGPIGNLGIDEFNLPETVSINGYSKKIGDEIRNKLKVLQNLTRDVINQTLAQKESMLQYNINSPLLDTITQITRLFNNKNFMKSKKSWSLNDNSSGIRNLKITPTPTSSKSNPLVCNFFDNLRINLFNYEKIVGRSENCGEYSGRIIQSINSTQNNCTFKIIIREPMITVIRKSTEEYITELVPSGKQLVMFNFTRKHPNRQRRQEIGKDLSEAFTNLIKNRIGTVVNPIELVEICQQPFKNAKNIYKWFSPDEPKQQYYFAVDDEYIDPTNFSSELKLIDIMMKNITKFESIEVRYLPDDVTNLNLSIRNVSANLIQAGNGMEPTELNFTMDLFQLIMNYSATETLTDIKVRTNGFKMKSFINESLIQEVFEKTTSSFIKRVLSNQTNEKPQPPVPLLTQPKNELFNVIGIEYLNATYDITNQTAYSIAKILWDFHDNTENQTPKHEKIRLDNSANDLQDFKLADTSMNYTFLGIQDETCDFEKAFRANEVDFYVALEGSITKTSIPNQCFPFSLSSITSSTFLREKEDSGFQTEMKVFVHDRIFVNTNKTDINSSDRTTMEDIIKDYAETITKKTIDESWRFSGIFDICIDPVKRIVKNKIEAEKYFYLISNPSHNQSFHLPLRINYIAIWGFSNYNSIKTTKFINGTVFQFVVKNLVARVNWTYQYEENAWSNSTQIMDLHAGYISLAGQINKKTSELTWRDTRLIFKILMLPPPKKKTITVERIMHKVNETMLYHIRTYIENNFNLLRNKKINMRN